MLALLVLLAAAAIAADPLALPWLAYVAKPAATLTVIAVAARTPDPVTPRYRALVTAGLVASLAGDVLLMLPQDLFVPGLGAFLVAHLFYINAFAGTGGGARGWGAFGAVALVAAVILAVLWPTLGAMRLPVAAYVSVIATMAWQALARRGTRRDAGAAMAAAGAVLFMASDAAIAVARFVTDFPARHAFILVTYWAAQWLIASSVAAPRKG